MSRPQAVDTDVWSGGGRRCDDSSAPVARAEATGCTTCTTAAARSARTRGVAAGRSAQRACERSCDWRRGAAGSPDPDSLPCVGSPDPDLLKRLADGGATGGDAAVAGEEQSAAAAAARSTPLESNPAPIYRAHNATVFDVACHF